MSSDLAADATPVSAAGSLTADTGTPSSDGEPRAGAAVSLHDVSVGYGGVTVLRRLSLRIGRGELVGIAGPSGSGKTTLVRLLTGRADHHHGDVEVLGARVRAGGTPADVGYVPQLDAIDWDFPLTVEQVVLLGDAARSAPVPWFRRAERREARAVLERLGIGALHGRRIRELSGGQRQRMFLARALLRRSRLLLLDEPTSGVDPSTRRDVLAVLGDLHAQGLTIVLTTHDLNFVASHLPRIVCLNGSITADGDPRTVLTPASLERTYGAPMKVLRDGDRAVVVDADDLRLPPRGAGHRPSPVAVPVRPDPDTELWP